MHNNLQKLFDKKMTRKEFLAHVGAGALLITGVSGMLKSLLDYSPGSKKSNISGYGSSSYGGRKK